MNSDLNSEIKTEQDTEQKAETMEDKNKAVVKEVLSTVLYFLGVLVAAILIVKFVVQRTEVEGQSMEPTLYNGENLMVDKLSYRFHDPKRFDVIVLQPFPEDTKTMYIKRIIALPGETIQIKQDGTILINGEKLVESYGKEVIKPEQIGRASQPITLGENEYFVMGDNRNNSGDSRSPAVGNVPRSRIIGKAWIRIWPLNKFGAYEKKKK